MKTVPETLREAAELFEQRNKEYGDNYKSFGKWFHQFAGGIDVQTPHDVNRFALLFHIATKMSRYIETFNRGGHPDSLIDISVYAAMLKELDESYAGHEAVEPDDAPTQGHTINVAADKGEALTIHIDDELYESLLEGRARLGIKPGQGVFIDVCEPVPDLVASGPIDRLNHVVAGVGDIDYPRCVCGHLRGIHRFGYIDTAGAVVGDGMTPEYLECNDSACGCKKYAEATPSELGVSRG